jgi:threonine/homoserine/homoserine lactone efflux protein
MKKISYNTTKFPGLLRKIVALIATAVLAALVLMFSAVLFAIIMVVGSAAFVYLWWKTHELRKQMRNFQTRSMMSERIAREEAIIKGELIEGEVIRVVDPHDVK